MRVVMNGLITLKPKTGVGHYVAELHAALQKLPDVECSLYPGERIRSRKVGPAKAGSNSWSKSFAQKFAQSALPWHFAAYTRAFKFDLYHEPNFVPFKSHLPTVVTVHDLSVVKFPQWHPSYRVKNHEKAFLPGLQRAARIITDSESVRQELIAELGILPEKVTAIPIAIGPQFTPQSAEAIVEVRRKHELPERFFLCVGTVEPRKNLGLVMRAFADLPAEVRSRCPLILAGPWGWRSEDEREFFEKEGRAAGIRHLGYVDAEDLPALYSAARVLLYPSHYEGFGLPPLEMLACGGAVIASTATCLREVLGTHAELLDPNDLPAWRSAMLKAATDDEYLQQLRQDGTAHAAQFTWDRCARETANVYRSIL
jgi:alpha-1,3-rhamnosyl/mannosyltransferase